MMNILKTTFVVFLGIVAGIIGLSVKNPGSETVSPSPSPQSIEQQAQEAWMKGCVPHLMEETHKLTDVVDEQAATAKAQIYCQCDWDYMVNSMGLSLEDIASIGQDGSRGSRAITEAQNYCYEKLKGNYYP